jgi:histone deacetylase complex regulatory component SIN3
MVTERVKKLFRGHPKLIRDFNYFLPLEHKIK